jgi:hypothetical protein
MSSDINSKVWAEYYRPKTVDECILPEAVKTMVMDNIKSVMYLTSYSLVQRERERPRWHTQSHMSWMPMFYTLIAH